MKHSFVAVLVAFLVLPPVVAGQGLAGIARQEEERRKAIKAGKVYTNGTLKADPHAPPPAAPPSNQSAPAPADPASPAPSVVPAAPVPAVNLPAGQVEPSPVRDEQYWRNRIGVVRSALERNRLFADALQSRVNALNTDFVNRDDPAQRSQIDLERQRALTEIERVKKEMADQTKTIAAVEEEARKAGVPAGWLR